MAFDIDKMDGVGYANYKTIGEMQTVNVLGHQNRLQLLAESSLGQILNKMNGLDPAEAASIGGVVRSDLSKDVAALGAAVSSIQQMMKGAQTTLPETGQGA
jgi:hypothetical protein